MNIVWTVALCQFNACSDCFARIYIYRRCRRKHILQLLLEHICLFAITGDNLISFLTDAKDSISHELVLTINLLKCEPVRLHDFIKNITHLALIKVTSYKIVKEGTQIVE